MNRQAIAALLGWQRTIDAAWQHQTERRGGQGREPDPQSPLDWIKERAGELGELFEELTNEYVEGVGEIWGEVGEGIGELGEAFGEGPGAVVHESGELLGEVGGEYVEELRELGGEYVEGVGEVWGGPDRLEAAVTDVDVNAIDPAPVWRQSDEPLYRSDTREPGEIFEDGFGPLDPTDTDLSNHVYYNDPSAFVSTTRNEELYRQDLWEEMPYRYTINAPGGIDVVATIPEAHEEFPGQDAIEFPGGVDPRFVEGVHRVNPDGTLGEWIPNPYYDPD